MFVEQGTENWYLIIDLGNAFLSIYILKRRQIQFLFMWNGL